MCHRFLFIFGIFYHIGGIVKHFICIFVLFCYYWVGKVLRRGLNKFNEAQSEPFCWYCCQQRDLIQHNAATDYPPAQHHSSESLFIK